MQKIKTLFLSLLLLAAPLAVSTTLVTSVGCTTTQKRVAYNSVYSVAIAVDGAMKSYAELYVKGEVSPESWARVKDLHEFYRAALQTAIAAVKYDLSKDATADLIRTSADLLAVIKRK